MNVSQVKLLCWSTAGLLAVGLGLYVTTFIRDLEEMRRAPDADRIRSVLEAVEPPKVKAADVIDYADVRRLFLSTCERCKTDPQCAHLNWTGKPPPPPVVNTEPEKPAGPERIPVKELVRLLMVQVDLAEPKQSMVFLRYRQRAGVPSSPALGVPLKVGARLAHPQDRVRIESITAEGVLFAFDDEGREKELLLPDEFDGRATVVQVGPDGVVRPRLTAIPLANAAPWRPERTTSFGRNRWMLGTEDMDYAGENFADIVARDLRTGRHQDPRTGRYDGIEIKSVTPGSFAARHGAEEGDVIKSINGHPVTSVQEAIHFVKTHSNQYTTWEVVVEKKGKLVTHTYHSPQN